MDSSSVSSIYSNMGTESRSAAHWAKFVAVQHIVSGGISLIVFLHECLNVEETLDEWQQKYFGDGPNTPHHHGHDEFLNSWKNKMALMRLLRLVYQYSRLVAGIIFSIVWINMGLLLLYGVIKKNLNCLLTWVIFTFVSMSVSIISLIFAMYQMPEYIALKVIDLAQIPVGIWAVNVLRQEYENNCWKKWKRDDYDAFSRSLSLTSSVVNIVPKTE